MSTSRVTREVVGELQAIATAIAEVEPVVGPIVACDSAGQVYAQALARLDVDVIGTGLAGASDKDLQATYRALRRMGARPSPRRARVAMDAKTIASRNEMFPNWSRLRPGA